MVRNRHIKPVSTFEFLTEHLTYTPLTASDPKAVREAIKEAPQAPVKAISKKKRRVLTATHGTCDVFRCIQFDEVEEGKYEKSCRDQQERPKGEKRRVTFADPLTEEIPAPEYHYADTELSSSS